MLREGGGVEKDPGGAAGTAREQTKDQVTRKSEHGTPRGLGQLCACPDALSESRQNQHAVMCFHSCIHPAGEHGWGFQHRGLSIRAGECCRRLCGAAEGQGLWSKTWM